TDVILRLHLKPALCGGSLVLPIWPACHLHIFFLSSPIWGLTFYLQAFLCFQPVVRQVYTK
ncbi:MAG: hypothetical protein IJT76_00220, partial [Clostridia bacterium]|nr:hypothetical protein [Clostridia bacterium]